MDRDAVRAFMERIMEMVSGAAVLGVIPPVILTLIFQRYLVAGLSRGAVKE